MRLEFDVLRRKVFKNSFSGKILAASHSFMVTMGGDQRVDNILSINTERRGMRFQNMANTSDESPVLRIPLISHLSYAYI